MVIQRILLALVAIPLVGQSALAAEKNIVLFVTDDQSLDAGCFGNSVIQTPSMDALAADGTLFTHAFCTTASCSASRSVILTGLHNHANGHYGHQHDYHKFSSYSNIVSLPVLLGKAGFRTARCGKYHVAPESVYQFDVVVPGSSRSPVEMADNCREFIEGSQDRPFFLYLCTSDPHRNNRRAKELPEQPDRFGNPGPGEKGYPGVEEIVYDPAAVQVPGFLPDTPTCRAEIAQYYQAISRIDQGLGRLLEILKQAGRWDDTLVIFISDHGIAMPGAKTTVYEGGLRSPCLVRNPYGSRRGVASDAMISWVDIAPTILDFAGVFEAGKSKVRSEILEQIASPEPGAQQTKATRPGELHGRSFLSLLQEEHATGWDEVYASHTFHEIQMYYPMRVVRTRRYKLIWNIAYPLPFPFASDLWAAPTWQAQYRQGLDASYGAKTVGSYIQRPEFELYDLEQDPYEGNNLAGDSKFTKLLDEMKAKLRDFQQRTNDPWIMKWRYE
ncbi:MAG: sulfatase [Planctomycetales bacterium]|nr:sulfatase [Planctomycetales bacterium]